VLSPDVLPSSVPAADERNTPVAPPPLTVNPSPLEPATWQTEPAAGVDAGAFGIAGFKRHCSTRKLVELNRSAIAVFLDNEIIAAT
jgi:hypothetical protein